MNVTYEIRGQLFEWDAEKAAFNLRKHRVSFEKACEFSSTRSFAWWTPAIRGKHGRRLSA